MIVTRGLTKRYGKTVAVDGLSFTVTSGVVTGFLGPNGSGKSTTMRMVMGLDLPDAGHGDGERSALRRAALAVARGRRPPRRQGLSPGTHRPPAPALPGQVERHPRGTHRRGARHRRPDFGRRQAGRQVLTRHGPATRHRRRPARRPRRPALRRAGQRTRPRGHPLGPPPAARSGRRGPHRLGLEPPHQRDGAHRRAPGGHRPGHAHRRDERRGVRRAASGGGRTHRHPDTPAHGRPRCRGPACGRPSRTTAGSSSPGCRRPGSARSLPAPR